MGEARRRQKSLEAKIRKGWSQTRHIWDERTARSPRYVVNTYPILHALVNPRIGQGVSRLIQRSWLNAKANANDCECFGCLRPWRLNLPLTAALLVEHLDTEDKQPSDMGLLCGLCPDCAEDHVRITAALKRDFGGKEFSVMPFVGEGHS